MNRSGRLMENQFGQWSDLDKNKTNRNDAITRFVKRRLGMRAGVKKVDTIRTLFRSGDRPMTVDANENTPFGNCIACVLLIIVNF